MSIAYSGYGCFSCILGCNEMHSKWLRIYCKAYFLTNLGRRYGLMLIWAQLELLFHFSVNHGNLHPTSGDSRIPNIQRAL